MDDPDRQVGSIVHAFAHNVTVKKKCNQMYGGRWKVKMVQGIVEEVIITRSESSNRAKASLRVRFNLGPGGFKSKVLSSTLVRAGVLPEAEYFGYDNPEPIPVPDPVPDDIVVVAMAPVHDDTAIIDDNNIANDDNNNANIDINDVEQEVVHDEPVVVVQEPQVVVQGPIQQGIQRRFVNNNPGIEQHHHNGIQSYEVPHGTPWYFDDNVVNQQLNGNVPVRQWYLKDSIGEVYRDGTNRDKHMSRLEVFLLMFPPCQLDLIVVETDIQLLKIGCKVTTTTEILKFFGILVLITRCEFTKRRTLWSTTSTNPYLPAHNFGVKTGMSLKRFENIFKCIRFSKQPDERPEGMSSAHYRWMLVNNFVENFNNHRSSTYIPSDLLCVDESISRWYGLGGGWMNTGLPNYIAIDRKPENGCELQSAACGRSGVMMRLLLVKGKAEDAPDDDDAHTLRVLKQLVNPWFHTGRIVCGDSYFSSVSNSHDLFVNHGTRYIGVVKTSNSKYPMKSLTTHIELARMNHQGMYSVDPVTDTPYMHAYCWVDRDRRYFISTTGSLSNGASYYRNRLTQTTPVELGLDPEMVQIHVQQPVTTELYYSCCAAVDHHNRHRQDTLDLEKKIRVYDWDARVNHTILGMILVDTFLVYSAMTFPDPDPLGKKEEQKEFYSQLSVELIENRVGLGVATRQQEAAEAPPPLRQLGIIDLSTGKIRQGVDPHVTPTKRRRLSNGVETNYLLQGECRKCRKKTTHECSICADNSNGTKQYWVCGTKNGNTCFGTHLQIDHAGDEY